MKTIIVAIAVIFSISTQAQDVFDKSSTSDQREKEILNFIKSDDDLQREYRSGMSDLNAAKMLGFTSLGFMAVFVGARVLLSMNQDKDLNQTDVNGLYLGVMSFIGACVTGVRGIKFFVKGKSKTRDVMDFAEYKVNKSYGGGMDFKTTSKGLGLVYSF